MYDAVKTAQPGVKPVKAFKSAQAGTSRIWERIQSLEEPKKPKVERKAKGDAGAAKGAPAKAKAGEEGYPGQESAQKSQRSQGSEEGEVGGKRRAARGHQDRSGGGHAQFERTDHMLTTLGFAPTSDSRPIDADHPEC